MWKSYLKWESDAFFVKVMVVWGFLIYKWELLQYMA